MTLYHCYFDFSAHNSHYHKIRVVSDGGVDDFRHGFWIDESLKFCKTVGVKYWIPPSRILYIERRSGDDW